MRTGQRDHAADDRAPEASPRRHDPTALLLSHFPLLVLFGLGLVAYWKLLAYEPSTSGPEAIEGAEAFFFSPTDEAPLILFAVSAWLLFRRRAQLRVPGSPGRLAPLALILLTAASALAVWSHYVGAPELLIPSLSLMLLGGATFWSGARGLRAIWVPACFLLLAYRLPGVLVNQVIFPLQLWAASATAGLLDLLGIVSLRYGDQIFTQSAIFQVIESCAGLRSIETLLMSSVVYVELLGRSGLRAALLVLAAPFIGLVVNLVRVFTIVVNPYSELAGVHTLQGLVMLVLGVILIAVLDAILHWRWRGHAPAPQPADGNRVSPTASVAKRLMAPVAALGIVAVANGILPPWGERPARATPLSTLPARLEGWRAEGLKLEKDFVGSVGFSEWVHRRYTNGDAEVVLFLGSDDRMSPRRSLVSPKNALPGSGWEVEKRFSAEIGDEGLAAEAAVLRSPKERRLVYHWYQGVDGFRSEVFRAVLGLDRSPLRRPGRAIVVRASTPVSDGQLESSEEGLQEFVRIVRGYLGSIPAARRGDGVTSSG